METPALLNLCRDAAYAPSECDVDAFVLAWMAHDSYCVKRLCLQYVGLPFVLGLFERYRRGMTARRLLVGKSRPKSAAWGDWVHEAQWCFIWWRAQINNECRVLCTLATLDSPDPDTDDAEAA